MTKSDLCDLANQLAVEWTDAPEDRRSAILDTVTELPPASSCFVAIQMYQNLICDPDGFLDEGSREAGESFANALGRRATALAPAS